MENLTKNLEQHLVNLKWKASEYLKSLGLPHEQSKVWEHKIWTATKIDDVDFIQKQLYVVFEDIAKEIGSLLDDVEDEEIKKEFIEQIENQDSIEGIQILKCNILVYLISIKDSIKDKQCITDLTGILQMTILNIVDVFSDKDNSIEALEGNLL